MLSKVAKTLSGLAMRVSGFQGWRVHVLAVCAGAFGVLGQAPFHLWPASLISLVILVWLLDGAFANKRPLRAGAARAFFFAFGQFMAGLYWIGAAFISRGPEYIPFMPFALVLLMAGLALIWALAGAVVLRFWTKDARRIAVFALGFFAAEWVRGHAFTGFPWNLPGMVWTPGGAISQSASLMGVWGLSLLTLFVFAAPAALVGVTRAHWRAVLPSLAGGVAFLGFFIFGVLHLGSAQNEVQENVRLRVVQAKIDQREKWKPENREAVLDHYLRLSTASPLDQVSHVIWPEGALPTLLLEDGPALDRIAAIFRDGPALLTGITRRERGDAGKVLYRNSLIALSFADAQPRVETVYDKHHLVPFGEYMPLAGLFSALGIKGLINFDDGFTPGPAPSSMEIDNLPVFSPQICYEIAYSRFTPKDDGRPDWILNISNDAWFGPTTGPYQHLDHARFRAIEEGVPVVRSVSSGIAGIIDPYGRMVLQLGRNADRAGDENLPKSLPITPFRRHGSAILFILAGAIFSFRLFRA
jgi:apolipoprotein N-acyltransferase